MSFIDGENNRPISNRLQTMETGDSSRRRTSANITQMIESPGSFSSDAAGWSYPESQYRQSAILEMGSAVPMEIVNPEEPREIQIQKTRDSIVGMNEVLKGFENHRDILKQISPGGKLSRHAYSNSTSSMNTSSRNYKQTDTSGELGETWVLPTSSSSNPPNLTAPLSPLNYPPSIRKGRKANIETPQSTNETFTTAHESGDEDSIGNSSNKTAPEYLSSTEPQNRNMSSDSWRPSSKDMTETLQASPISSSRQRKRLDNMTKLRQLIDEEAKLTAAGNTSQHSRSVSEPAGFSHPLPDVPNTSSPQADSKRMSILNNPNEDDASRLPHELIQELSKDDGSGHPVRRSSRRRGYDTVAPNVALKGETAILDAENLGGPNQTSKHSSEPKHGAGHHHKSQSDSSGLRRNNSHGRRRRNFSKKSIENMMQQNPSNYDINDIDLPTPERRLIEKFIDSLSKLSIEVQMDERKREEGLRRLHNALRALEGWI